jgi:WD40 repeat protein
MLSSNRIDRICVSDYPCRFIRLFHGLDRREWRLLMQRRRFGFWPIGLLAVMLGGSLQSWAQPDNGRSSRTDLQGDPLPPGVLARMGSVRFSHGRPVQSTAFAPDGKTVATISGQWPDDKKCTLHLWDVATGKELRRVEDLPSRTDGVHFSPNGKFLAASAERNIAFWDPATGKKLRQLAGNPEAVHAFAFSPDGKTLAVAGGRPYREVRDWEASDCTVRLLDVATGKELAALKGHKAYVKLVAFSPDGKTLVSCGGNVEISAGSSTPPLKGDVCAWDPGIGKLLRRFPSPGDPIALSPDSHTLAFRKGRSVGLWDVETGKTRCEWEQEQGGVMSEVVFSPDSKILAVGKENKQDIRDVRTGKRLRSLRRAGGGSGFGSVLGFSPDGSTVAWERGSTLQLWDVASGTERRPFGGHSAVVTCVAFAADPRTVASGSEDQTVRLWDADTGKELRQWTAPRGWPLAVAFSPDGKALAAGYRDRPVSVWDTATGKAVFQATRRKAPFTVGLAFSPDSKTLIAGDIDGKIRLYEPASGKEVGAFKGQKAHLHGLALAPDGRTLACAGGDEPGPFAQDTARLWRGNRSKDLVEERPPMNPTLPLDRLHREARAVAFSADNKFLASGQGWFDFYFYEAWAIYV